MVKCCVCNKPENFFSPIKSNLDQTPDGKYKIEKAEDNERTLAFNSVDFDFEEGFYMGFVCSESCQATFDTSPTSFISGMVEMCAYSDSKDKSYNFS